MHFTGEFSLGSLSIVVTLISVAIGLGIRMGSLQEIVRGQATTLIQHAGRLDRYENRLVDVTGNLQRVVGRIEATQDRIDKRTGNRLGEGYDEA